MQALRSESEQMAALARGEVRAFDALYSQYQRPVYANILKMVKDVAAAEDLLQEVFVALWEHRLRLDLRRPVGGWLFVVSHNKAAAYLKKRVRETLALSAAPAPDGPAAEQRAAVETELFEQQWARLEAAAERLPARQQRVFRLCRYEGKSAEEAAALVGISVASVKDYLKQATLFIRGEVRGGLGRPGRPAAGSGAVVSGLLLLLGSG